MGDSDFNLAVLIAFLPTLGKLIDLGFQFITPSGVKVTSLEELKALTMKLKDMPDLPVSSIHDTEGDKK